MSFGGFGIRAAGALPQLIWETEQSGGEPGARQLLSEVMEQGNPLEPFDRAAEGLAEAFGDDRVKALTEVSGLVTVVSLSSLPEGPEYPVNRSLAAHEAVQKPSEVPRLSLTLAERLLGGVGCSEEA